MASSSQPLAAPRSAPSRWTTKHTLWLLLGLTGISVLFSTELPILRDKTGANHDYFLKLIHDRLLLIPHAVCGILATCIGPLQFSSSVRRKHLTLHRILGRVYVGCIFIAAPIAIIISWGSGLIVGTITQAGLWMLCTLMAFLTARNRHIVQHRQWMVRSYAVTFTFISLRVLNFIPAYADLSTPNFNLVIILVTFASAFVIPDIAFHGREITTRRA
jgi:uncharacterized membrane protein